MALAALVPTLALTIPKEYAIVPYIVLFVLFIVFFAAVQALHLKAKRYFDKGDWDKALKFYEYTWWLFGVASKKDVRPIFDFNLAKINAARSRPQRAIEYYLKARRTAIEVDNPLIIAMSSIEIGKLYAGQQDWERAINAYKEARKLSEAHPKKPYLIKILMSMADAYSEHKENAEAVSLLMEARRICELRQDVTSSIHVWVALGKLFYDQGNWEKAREHFNEALNKAGETRAQGKAYALARIWSGRLYVQTGFWDEARADLREAMTIARKMKERSALFAATLELGRLASDQGNSVQAIEFLSNSLKWAKELKDPKRQAMAYQALGAAYLSDDNDQEAFINLKKANTLLKKSYQPRIEALVLAGLALYYDGRGDQSQARQSLHLAEKLAKSGDAQYELVAIYDAFAAMYAHAKKADLAVAYQRKAHGLRQKLGIRAALSELYVEM